MCNFLLSSYKLQNSSVHHNVLPILCPKLYTIVKVKTEVVNDGDTKVCQLIGVIHSQRSVHFTPTVIIVCPNDIYNSLYQRYFTNRIKDRVSLS